MSRHIYTVCARCGKRRGVRGFVLIHEYGRATGLDVGHGWVPWMVVRGDCVEADDMVMDDEGDGEQEEDE